LTQGKLDLSSRATLLALRTKLEQALAARRLEGYRPYAKQREFHAAGARYRERMLMAANQVGKTLSAGAEMAMHLTGRYPSWWEGRVWHKAIVAWSASVSFELTRDGAQRILMGRPNAIGTGMIPKDAIKDHSMRRGAADSIDTVVVKHGGGGDVQAGESQLTFKAYEQGREKFQAETLDFAWLDEEPDDLGVYTETLTRTNTTRGLVAMTFTPLKGMSDVVCRFLLPAEDDPGKVDRHVVSMTIDDAEHYTPEERAQITASYPAHEREARAKGVPVLGSGRIFPVEESIIKCEPFPLPPHWPRLAAMDFGWDHPTAAAWIAWDRDADIVYVYDVHRLREQPPAVHAAAIKGRGEWIPMAWPHDGNNDTAAGPKLASQYRDLGVKMLPEMAKFPEEGDRKDSNTRASLTSVEAGISEMLERMNGGRLKVFSHLNDWFEEFRLYHRKDGKIVKVRDDLMSATRYAIMTLRFAALPPKPNKINHRRATNWRA